MGKINSIYTKGKTYFKRFFALSEKSVEKPVSIVDKAAEPQKVYSKQIEAYYRRYGKAVKPKQAGEIQECSNLEKYVTKQIEQVPKKLEEEVDAYNQRRFVEVSKEALQELEHNFEEKKKKVIEIVLANPELLSPQYISMVKRIKTPEDLSLVLRSYILECNNGLNKKYRNVINGLLNGKNVSLKDQQKLFSDETKNCDAMLEMIKTVTEPSTDKRVIQVENFLKQTYGMDYVHLERAEEAKKILETIKLVQKHNIPLPKNIIITPYTSIQTGGQNMAHSATNYTIMISSQKERNKAIEEAYKKIVSPELEEMKRGLLKQDENLYPTHSLLHLYVHEFTHSDQAVELLLPVKAVPIPVKYIDAYNKMSDYAKTSRRELQAELRTKYILDSLSEDKKALLDYLS